MHKLNSSVIFSDINNGKKYFVVLVVKFEQHVVSDAPLLCARLEEAFDFCRSVYSGNTAFLQTGITGRFSSMRDPNHDNGSLSFGSRPCLMYRKVCLQYLSEYREYSTDPVL